MNIFVIFLICSALIWLISKLSETYTQRSSFKLSYVNVPDSLLLTGASKEKVDVQLRASGFQFLSFNFGDKDLKIDLSNVNQKKAAYFVNQESYQKQIETQLPGNMALLDIDEDTLFVRFKKLFSKEVRVVPDISLDLAPNYLLEGSLEVNPSTVVVKGPKNEIESLDEVNTSGRTISQLSEGFTTTLELVIPEALSNTSLSVNSVEVSGKVFRFSEKLIEIPVKVINIPEGSEIKTFPQTVSILCKARIDILKSLGPETFELVADFNDATPANQKLEVRLTRQPEDVYDVQLKQNSVEYILIRR